MRTRKRHSLRIQRRADFATLILAACTVAVSTSSCSSERPPQRYRVTVEVYSDLNPLPGAQLSVRGRPAGATGANGAAQLLLTGSDGTVVPVTVRCPERTRSPAAPIDVTLRTVQVIDRAAAARGVVHRVNCPPQDRTVAVIVRTDGRGGLPVVWQGREVSRTDPSGVAHLTFRMQPSSQFQLALATDSQPALRPSSPAHQFVVPDADDVFVWDQEFHDDTPVRARPHAHFARPVIRHIGPIRIR
jgi:hypothetical protein